MLYRVTILFCFYFILSSDAFASPGYGDKGTDTVQCLSPDTFLEIKGRSNINSFSLIYSAPPEENIYKSSGGADIISLNLRVPVKMFRTSNRRLFDDFLSLVKAESYPYILISVHSEDFNEALPDALLPERINVTIAGKTNEYLVDCSMTRCTGGVVVTGSQSVSLDDFNLVPQSKFLGMVKVDNNINVSFRFIVNFTH